MNETRVTVHGNVVTAPVVRETRTGGVFVTFRIATTPVRRTADGKFVDGETSFYGVIAFGALGANIGASLRKGQPVVVEGKLSTREWQGSDGSTRQSTEIDAEHVGHDLVWGRASFERLSRAAALGHDRLSDPEVAGALRGLVDRPSGALEPTGSAGDSPDSGESDERPANVDENGEVHGEPGEVGSLRSRGAVSVGDPATDDYEVIAPMSA